MSITDINPEDIPEVPTNKFLMRGDSKDDKRDGKYFSITISGNWAFL